MITQENKDLLLKDLSARLPYGVKVYVGDDLAMTLRQIDYKCFCESWENEDFKCHSRWMLPYLRPMSSMTEEEKEELNTLTYHNISVQDNALCGYICSGELVDVFDWLNSHHFDYRELIPKGLAIEVTEDNNPYK